MTDEQPQAPKRTARGGPPPAEGAPRGRGVASERRRAERKRQARETLLELADLLDALRGRGQAAPAEDLVEIVRRDADRMAETMASVASRAAPIAWLVDHAFGAGGPLSIVVAFGPFLRALLTQARELRERHAAEEPDAGEQPPPVYPFEQPAGAIGG